MNCPECKSPIDRSIVIHSDRFFAESYSIQQCPTALSITEGTVKFHVNNILSKLEVSDRTQAVITAFKRGFARLE